MGGVYKTSCEQGMVTLFGKAFALGTVDRSSTTKECQEKALEINAAQLSENYKESTVQISGIAQLQKTHRIIPEEMKHLSYLKHLLPKSLTLGFCLLPPLVFNAPFQPRILIVLKIIIKIEKG